ncbi:MAG: hypothetical protein AB8H03_17285 [Saprospiraceae bacterium]
MPHFQQTNHNTYSYKSEKPTVKLKWFEKYLNWENYPKNVFLFPLYLFGIWKAIINRRMWLFSTSNPNLTFGSFFGLTKSEVYQILPPNTFPNTVLVHPADSFGQVVNKIAQANLSYPIVVKPDVGMVGLLVRIIEDEKQLRSYYDLVKADWIAQEYISYDIEVGLFYVRNPNEKKGKIVGLSEKKPLSIIGDGKSTLRTLVENDSRTTLWKEEIFRKKKKNWNTVPAKGEFVQLMYTGNRKTGARLVELVNKIDEDLVDVFDKISHHSNQIFYGRYDIKCTSLEDLKKGKDFTILEFNGVHSGYGHLYHCGKSAKEAYQTIFRMWQDLFQICMINHQNGARFTSFWEGWKKLFQVIRHFIKLSKWEKKLP